VGDATNGAKAGVIAGIVYGLVLGITSYFSVIGEKSAILSAISQTLPSNSPFTAEQLYGIVVLLTPAVATVVGLIGGIIIGAVYGSLYRRVPGKTPVTKGISVGLLLWVLISVLGGLRDLQYGVVYYATEVGVGLVSTLLFGVLLGFFYGRFSRPRTTDSVMQGP
jgi:hypothetical protein